jgi:hypothetical protein
MMDPIEKFHAHLDLCAQCREHPFDLCEAGGRLLVATAGPSKPFSMGSTVTGRPVSEPRLQNIPIRTELGKQIRNAFVAQPGEMFIAGNYSALEIRMYQEFGGDHDAHDVKDSSCMFCEAGIPKRGAK